MTVLLNPWKLALTCSLFVLTASTVGAQEIKWRTDYAAARLESESKNLPLLIYFTRPACFFCDKLEQNTYRDPRIIALLKDKVIALKINAPDQPTLIAKLEVSAYPTLLLARPDSQYEIMVGYQEANVLHDKLQRVLATLTPSITAKTDYENAVKWESAGEYARAVSTLRGILDDGKARPFHPNAEELLQKIEKRALDRLALAKDMQAKGQNAKALEALTEMQRLYAGLKASAEAGDLITKLVQANSQLRVEQRNKRARDLLTQAKQFYETKDYIPCHDRCQIILANYGDLQEGQEAYILNRQLNNNPEWLQSAAAVMADRLGEIWLAQADMSLKRGEMRQAQVHLQNVVRAFPGSRLAESAQIRLNQLQATVPVGAEIGSARP